MPPTPRFSEYDWGGGREWIMSFGPEDTRQVLIIPPLLEELNRTRKLLSDTMRTLAEAGVASHLPDLPGTGESEMALEDVRWKDWRSAAKAAAEMTGAAAIVSVRGGSLLDDATGHAKILRFAPVEGKRLIRDLIRARSLTDESFDGAAQKAVFETGITLLGGYPISAEFAVSLRDAEPATIESVQTVRLEGDHSDADAHIAGQPLWRRAEPSGSPDMAAAFAEKIESIL